VIGFLEPMGLVALAALLLPVLIHFVRRPEEQVVDFAALRWISQRTKPRRRLRLRERVLLVLRLLLIAALSAILASPYWRGHGHEGAAWVAVVPGVNPDAARAAVGAPDAQWHWLVPGFPALASVPKSPGSNPASLARELDVALPPATQLTLVVPATLTGMDAERLAPSHTVNWQVLPGIGPTPESSAAAALPPHLSLRADIGADREARVVRALVKSWDAGGIPVTLDVAGKNVPPAADTDWLFWLGGTLPAPIRDWARRGGTVLASGQPAGEGVPVIVDGSGQTIVTESAEGRGRLLLMGTAMTPEAQPSVGEPDFPRRLRAVLAGPAAPPDRASAVALAPGRGNGLPTGPRRPLDAALGLLAAGLFLLERLWATRPGRHAT